MIDCISSQNSCEYIAGATLLTVYTMSPEIMDDSVAAGRDTVA